MKYLCLCYYDPRKFDALSDADREAFVAECPPRDRALHETGRVVALGSLAAPADWKSIRAGDAASEVEDGPFLNASEQAGAFFIVEADSIDEAVEIARLHPSAHVGRYIGGGIEVSACDRFEQGATS